MTCCQLGIEVDGSPGGIPAAGAGVLIVSTLSAAYLLARRATTVDPTVSLRQE